MSTGTETWARRVGLAVGLLAAVLAVWAWRVEGGAAALDADVAFTAVPPGELTVAPAGEFLTAHGLERGAGARGVLRLRNIAGAPVEVRLRARPSSRELDRGLRVEVRARSSQVLFAGPLGGLRRWSRPFAIPRGASRTLAMHVRAASGGSGGATDVAVELRAEVRGG